MSPEHLRSWCDALRIQVREQGGLMEPTYAAGVRAGILQAVRMLEVFIDRAEALTDPPTSLWRVTQWGDESAHASWRAATYSALFGQLRDATVEILHVDVIAPGLVHVRVIDADDGHMFPVEVVLEEVQS